ncbi:NfeD family protein [Desulfonatronum thioautotrophicum]|uniref:NfeD family protein n=1 Tax=Desulfonatronum thioautotrophicum TaxID=617001 RepID=UPI0005EB4036|nr:NfeD family protein [Desulfonatronum thioautotrophicum]
MIPDAWITPWLAWFLAAIAFATLEMFLPIFIFLFIAIGCLGVALALLLFDLSLTQQLILFIVVTISSLLVLRKSMMRIFRGVTADRSDTDFNDFPYGERVQVLRAIKPPQAGRIQHRGTAWDAVADEPVDAGTTVEIIGYTGSSRQTFHVRKSN